MHPFFQDYLERLITLHQDILKALDELPPEVLDWTPLCETTGDMNSINVLVTHLCGAERYWIGDIACDDPSDRVRDAEFLVSRLTAQELKEKIDAATAYAQSAVAKLAIDELPTVKSRLNNGLPVSTGWALLHALEHTAVHLGHIQITRQLWDEKINHEN